jgi:hypothetical protein
MLLAHEEILSIQLVTNNKYARQVRSCAAGFTVAWSNLCNEPNIQQWATMLSVYELVSGDNNDLLLKSAEHVTNMTNSLKNFTKTTN